MSNAPMNEAPMSNANALSGKLHAIRVKTEVSSGNIPPLLHEIRHALAELMANDAPNIIDLKGIPLAEGEQDAILKFLGKGEVEAVLETLGKSEIIETSYPGVWIVTHFDEEDAIKARFIEVTRMPEILQSQSVDIADGLKRLEATLQRK